MSLLFALDAFGGGFVIQSIIAYWFHVRFALDPAMLGTVFLCANLLAGISLWPQAGSPGESAW